MSQWFKVQRMLWIGQQVLAVGRINRRDIMVKFGLSAAWASRDLQDFQQLNHHPLRYDSSAKAYVLGVDAPHLPIASGAEEFGAAGGLARAAALSPQRRSEISRRAALARWRPDEQASDQW